MAIQQGGTTVISNNRQLQSVNGLKTVGGQSILGSGDIGVGGGGFPWMDDANAGNGTLVTNNAVNNNTWNTVIAGSANVGRWVHGHFRRQSINLSTAPTVGLAGNGSGSFLVGTGTGGGQGANIYTQNGGLIATNKTNYALTCAAGNNYYMNSGYFYGYIAAGDNLTARRTYVNVLQWDE